MSDVTDLIPYADRDPFPMKISDGVRIRKTDDGYVVERLKPDLTWEELDVSGGAVAWGNITGTLTNQSNVDTDDTLAADSDEKLATQKAVKAYVDANAGVGGDVVGPASATEGHLAVFADGTGKLIEDGGAVPGGGGGAYRLGPFKIGAFNQQLLQVLTNQTVDGGTWQVSYGGDETAALAWNISAANLKTALNALPSVIAIGSVISVAGTDVNVGYEVKLSGPFGGDGGSFTGVFPTSLTGPDSPYEMTSIVLDSVTELFTPNAGDTILDFQHAVITEFDSGDPATMAYTDSTDNPFSLDPGWSSAGDNDLLIKLNVADLPTGEEESNFRFTTATDPGDQRSARAMQLAYSTPGPDGEGGPIQVTIPTVCVNSVPIYAAIQNIGSSPTSGEVWIWVDIVPATAP